MKKIIRKVFLLAIVGISLILVVSPNAYAFTKQISYTPIDNTKNLEVKDLSFSDITFKDYSSTSTKAFGLTGTINNHSSDTINYDLTVYYYDINYKLVAQESVSKTAISGISDFNQMSNLNSLSQHSVNEIYYYSLSIYIDDTNNSKEEIDPSYLTPSKNSQYFLNDYVLDKYDINIIVNENNTLDITETITANFRKPKHGIIRTIPLKNTITRLDGTKSTNRTKVTNVSVNKEYKKSKANNNYKLQIGSANRSITGEQTYIIKYTYNLGKDPMKDYDELYYNIIGTDWDTAVGNITFTITMPKDFDSSKLGFSSGSIGSTNNSKVKYTVSGTKITGNYNGILAPNQALTIRCELPEGYFVGAGIPFDINEYIPFILPIIFATLSILLWYKFGRDDVVIETVEFYPPEGLNSLDIGFLYNGKARSKDVTSLLIYLANKGYIEISNKRIEINSQKLNLSEETINNANQKVIELQNKINEEKAINPNSKKIKYYENMLDIYKNIDTPIDFKQYNLTSSIKIINNKSDFLIRKVKDYDGTNIHEKWFMEGLFENGRTEVTSKMLYNSFYVTTHRILNSVNCSTNINKVFEKSASNKKIFVILMIIATYCLITIPPLANSGLLETLPIALFLPSIGFSLFFAALFNKDTIISKVFELFFGLAFITPCIPLVLPPLKENPIYLIGYIIGIICIGCMTACLTNLKKRTKYGNEMLGKLRGFKHFLETVEKEKLETLVMQNPNYFYDILPYTYVLNVSDKWIKKFETISMQAPKWYDDFDRFDIYSFKGFMDTAMTSTERAISSSPSSSSGGSSSGGSSSGGGSSGGGSGGGGGSSW